MIDFIMNALCIIFGISLVILVLNMIWGFIDNEIIEKTLVTICVCSLFSIVIFAIIYVCAKG